MARATVSRIGRTSHRRPMSRLVRHRECRTPRIAKRSRGRRSGSVLRSSRSSSIGATPRYGTGSRSGLSPFSRGDIVPTSAIPPSLPSACAACRPPDKTNPRWPTKAGDQARRDARLRPALRVLRRATGIRRCDVGPRASAVARWGARGRQRRPGVPALQSVEGRSFADRVFRSLSLGRTQLHRLRAGSAPCAEAMRQASGQPRVRASRVTDQ